MTTTCTVIREEPRQPVKRIAAALLFVVTACAPDVPAPEPPRVPVHFTRPCVFLRSEFYDGRRVNCRYYCGGSNDWAILHRSPCPPTWGYR